MIFITATLRGILLASSFTFGALSQVCGAVSHVASQISAACFVYERHLAPTITYGDMYHVQPHYVLSANVYSHAPACA